LPGDAYTDEANAGRLFRYFTLNFRAEHGRYPNFRDYREAGLDGLMAHYGYDKFKAFYLSGLMRRDSEYYDQELDYAPWEAFERLGRDYWKEGPNRAKAILNTQLAALTSDKPHFASYKDYNRSRLKGLLNYCSREKIDPLDDSGICNIILETGGPEYRALIEKNNYAGILEKLIAENRFNPFIEAVKKRREGAGTSHMKP